MEGTEAEAFIAASNFVVEVVETITPDQWDAPGLGEWNVRELVGHVNRAHLLIVEYVKNPVPEEPLDSEYFTPASIAGRGREAVALLGDDPVNVVKKYAKEATEFVRTTPDDAVLGSPFGTMTVVQYAPSRTAELTIHGLDLVRALGLEKKAPSNAVRSSLNYVASISVRKNTGEDVLMALSGRGTLPADFSVF